MASDPIDQVLLEMDGIVAWTIANNSRAGYFAALYRRVTQTVRDRIGTGYFDDDARMEALDVTFATRYLTAYRQWRGNDPMSGCWAVAFGAVAKPKLIILQNLLAGMNAHIAYDLGIATAETAGSLEGLESLHDDFNKINALLSCMVPTVFSELGELSPLIHLVEDIGAGDEEKLVDRVMNVARDLAWLLAHELVILQDLPRLQQKMLRLKDQTVAQIGKSVVQPGGSLEKIVHVVWIPESKDVAKNIAVLAAPQALPASCA